MILNYECFLFVIISYDVHVCCMHIFIIVLFTCMLCVFLHYYLFYKMYFYYSMIMYKLKIFASFDYIKYSSLFSPYFVLLYLLYFHYLYVLWTLF